MNALAPALSEGVNDIVNLIFVPWGNAYVNTTKCGTADYSKQAMYCWIEQCGKNAAADDECFDESKKICQHGDEEVIFLCLSFSLSVTREQESLSLSLSLSLSTFEQCTHIHSATRILPKLALESIHHLNTHLYLS